MHKISSFSRLLFSVVGFFSVGFCSAGGFWSLAFLPTKGLFCFLVSAAFFPFFSTPGFFPWNPPHLIWLLTLLLPYSSRVCDSCPGEEWCSIQHVVFAYGLSFSMILKFFRGFFFWDSVMNLHVLFGSLSFSRFC